MPLTDEHLERYSRQILLKEVGGAGQEALMHASVLVVGAGGLGSPVGIYLAAAGVGRLGVLDPDEVDISNLHRQIAFSTADVGRPKAEAFRDHLLALRADLHLDARVERLDGTNFDEVVASYDLVVDSSDNFETRFLVADGCRRLRRPLVTASLFQFEGQVTTILPDGPCYRCLYRQPPPPGRVPPCQEAGVLGATAGVVGTLQAAEAVKVLLGAGEPLVGRLLFYRALDGSLRVLRYARDPDCPGCGSGASVEDSGGGERPPACVR